VEIRVFDKDGVERRPARPGEPVVFHESDTIRSTITIEEAARLLRLPEGYAVVQLPNLAKACDCGDRPETTKGDMGHAFQAVEDFEVVEDAKTGTRYMTRTCRDCGLAYGRPTL
jgi:hypothetical protein